MSRLRNQILAAVFSASTLVAAPTAQGQSLSGNLTVDNYFTAYLSTSATALGTALVSGTQWTTTSSFTNVSLTPGQDFYLHIAAGDFGVISGVLGSFSLAGSGFQFANGQQTLNTNITDWTASLGGGLVASGGQQVAAPVSFAASVGQTPLALRSQGVNGVSPWGVRPGISSQAVWIWTQDNCINCGRYFTTKITSTVPEPGTWALTGAGVVALALFGLRRRSA